MCSISTRTDLTDHSINAHPRAALHHLPARPSGRYDETGSAASSTNTCRSQRIQKLLEDAGIKLDSVVSDILGVSARQMLEALVAGVRDVAAPAELARTRMRAKIPQLRQSLEGRSAPITR